MCLERQFQAYVKFAHGQEWNRSAEYRKLLDQCWNIVLDDQNADENIWYFHEKIRSDQLSKSGESNAELSVACIFSIHIEGWLDNLIDNSGCEEVDRLLALDFIFAYLDADERDGFYYDKVNHPLVVTETKKQAQDEADMKTISCFADTQKWYSQCESLI